MFSRLERIKNWAELARQAHYDATELAALCRISPSQLRRFFTAKFSTSPQIWLRQLRVRDAAEMILSSAMSLKEISATLRFSNEAQLSHHFKQQFGCPPSRFAAQNHFATPPNPPARP